MAQKRMFSKAIARTDRFLDMPQTAQNLYFHLGLEADDDGFVSPKMVMRTLGSTDDDLRVLVAKGFVIPFESGVVVITHWHVNNYLRSDRYKGTEYKEERASLSLENDRYTVGIPNVSKLDTQDRIGKDRIGKDTPAAQGAGEMAKPRFDSLGAEVIRAFEAVNPVAGRWYGNTTQRAAADRLIEAHGLETVKKVIALLPQTNAMPYIPTVTTPRQLEEKWVALEAGLRKEKAKLTSKKSNIAFS